MVALSRAAIMRFCIDDRYRQHSISPPTTTTRSMGGDCGEFSATSSGACFREIARLEGAHFEAMRLYEEAIVCTHNGLSTMRLAQRARRTFLIYGMRFREDRCSPTICKSQVLLSPLGEPSVKIRQLDELYPQLQKRGTGTRRRVKAQIGTWVEDPLGILIQLSKSRKAVSGEHCLEN